MKEAFQNPTFNQAIKGSVTVIGGNALPLGQATYSDVGNWGCNCAEALNIGDTGAAAIANAAR